MADVLSMIIGFTGLISLVVREWVANRNLRIVTFVFSAFMCLCALVLYVVVQFTVNDNWEMEDRERHYLRYVFFGFTIFAVLSAFYSDFALGALVHSWAGFPSSDVAAVYWVYIVARHLPSVLH